MTTKRTKAQKTHGKEASDETSEARADELLRKVKGLTAELRKAEETFLRKTAPLLQELDRSTTALKQVPDDSDETLKRITAEYEADLDDLARYLEEKTEQKQAT